MNRSASMYGVSFHIFSSDFGVQAIAALDKVHAALEGHALSSIPMRPSQHIDLLRKHTLGVVSHISDLLQEAHGHKTLQEKKKIIRGLTQLVMLASRSINSASPLVRKPFYFWA
jgi:hypothetical protein